MAANRQSGEGSGSSRFPDGFRILQGTREYITYLERSSIRIWMSDVAGHFDEHSHSAIEIIKPDRGVSEYRLSNAVYRIHAGEILIIPSGCVHSLTEYEDTQRYLFLFEPGPLTDLRDMLSISGMTQQPIYLRDDSELQGQVGDLLMQVADCYFRKEPMWNSLCYSYLVQMYALLGKRYLRAFSDQSSSAGRNIDSEIMNSALTYINEHYMDDIALDDVAVFAGFSRYYFSRVFKQFSGLTFSEYLTRKRLNIASDLLVHTRKSVREIAAEAGFGSVATFNRIFRQRKNCTPSQFRSIYGPGPIGSGTIF